MATVQKVSLSSEMRYLNERLRDGRAVLQDKFSMKRLGNPDPAFQPRVVHLDMQHVKDLDDIYQARGALDPVVLFHVPDRDLYILVDGFHRHEVYKRAGEDTIPAYVIEGTVEDAMEYAAMANQHAILKRQSEDIKKQIYILLAIPRWFAKSDTEIGRHVGVKSSVILRHRSSFCQETNTEFPKTYTRKDGREFVKPAAGGRPRIYKHSSQYVAVVRGKRVRLGKNIQSAERALDEVLDTTERKKAILHKGNFFHGWLPIRGVSLTSNRLFSGRYPGLGESACGYGRVVITARLDDPAAIYTAIGRLYALREILERPGDRLVMVCVCYPDDGPEALVDVARRLGVELLTPEELVASIKGDESDDPQASPVLVGCGEPEGGQNHAG